MTVWGKARAIVRKLLTLFMNERIKLLNGKVSQGIPGAERLNLLSPGNLQVIDK